MQTGVFGLVNHAHAAAAQLADNAIVRDGRVDHDDVGRRMFDDTGMVVVGQSPRSRKFLLCSAEI